MAMKLIYSIVFLILPIFISNAQTPDANFNLSFEKVTRGQNLPDKWMQWGMGYNLSIDSTEKHDGKVSLLIQPAAARQANMFGCVASSIPADYEG
jgi:hypothetical protein